MSINTTIQNNSVPRLTELAAKAIIDHPTRFPSTHTVAKCYLINAWATLLTDHENTTFAFLLRDIQQIILTQHQPHQDRVQYLQDNVHALFHKLQACLPQQVPLPLSYFETYQSVETESWITILNDTFTNIPLRLDPISRVTHFRAERSEENGYAPLLPSFILTLTQLRRLIIEDFQLQLIPSQLASLLHLKELCLKSNRITQLPHSIEKLSKLQTLDLSYNKMRSIPSQLAQLKRLTSLLLSHNKIRKIPTAMSRLTALCCLELDHNKISTIPTTISRLMNLTTLALSDNKISEIPQGLHRLTKLEILYLQNNKISEIPIAFARERSERFRFNLSNNPISKIEQPFFQIHNLQLLEEFATSDSDGELGPQYRLIVGNSPPYGADDESETKTPH